MRGVICAELVGPGAEVPTARPRPDGLANLMSGLESGVDLTDTMRDASAEPIRSFRLPIGLTISDLYWYEVWWNGRTDILGTLAPPKRGLLSDMIASLLPEGKGRSHSPGGKRPP